MGCCCKKIFRICDVVICDDGDLILPIPVLLDGNHVLELDFLGNEVSQAKEFSAGQSEMRFSKGELNEKFTYLGHVVGPDNTIVSFEIDGTTYDCVEFSTMRNLQALTSNESS